jgi:PTS system mannitol-specific IIA component
MNLTLLTEKTIRVNVSFATKEEAIRACGQLLLDAGHIQPDYIDRMIERDRLSTTYIGNEIAMPHGTKDARQFILSTGIAIIQVPSGVDFGGGNIARILVGLAAVGDEHMDILTEIAMVCSDDDRLQTLIKAKNPRQVLDVILGAEAAK